MSQTEWQMPRPDLGDTVLYSNDLRGFSDPVVGWVVGVGDTTISILTILPTGLFQRASVHHKDDPALLGDHGWHDLGCWQFAKGTAAIRELTMPVKSAEKATSGRETSSK